MVGIIGDGNTGRSGGEWIMKSLKDLVSAYCFYLGVWLID